MIFNYFNPRHIEILKEELKIAKKILNESSGYNEDEIWVAMSTEDRKEALLSVPNGSSIADKYASETDWNLIPDSITDRINLSDYQLASNDRNIGRVMLRGIESMKSEFKNDAKKLAAFTKLINGYCKKIGKQYDQLNTKQSVELNKKVGMLKQQFNPILGISSGNDASADYGKGPGNWTGD